MLTHHVHYHSKPHSSFTVVPNLNITHHHVYYYTPLYSLSFTIMFTHLQSCSVIHHVQYYPVHYHSPSRSLSCSVTLSLHVHYHHSTITQTMMFTITHHHDTMFTITPHSHVGSGVSPPLGVSLKSLSRFFFFR